MSRLDKINSLLIRELAGLVAREIYLPNGLITISFVECSPDLRYAKIGVSVLPETMSEPAIKKLNQCNTLFTRDLQKKLKLKFIPRFNWVVDTREQFAAEIEKALKEI